MQLTTIDGRSLGVAICQPAANKYLNWTSGAWETPFDGSKHVKPLAPVAPAPDPNAAMKFVDIGEALLSRPDVIAVTYAIDSGGGTPTYSPAELSLAPWGGSLGSMAVLTRL